MAMDLATAGDRPHQAKQYQAEEDESDKHSDHSEGNMSFDSIKVP